jgi:4-hydroxybenzoate polyprenyltransferase
VSVLPFNLPLLAYLKEAQREDRRLILVTGADRCIAEQVADYVGGFESVIASDGVINLTGRRKRDALIDRFGVGGFDYAGNARADLCVWQHANKAIVVNANRRVARQARIVSEIEAVFHDQPHPLRTLAATLRVHQWVKNVLVFVPLITSHRLTELPLVLLAACAFLAFSLCASSVYTLNDLIDLNSDRTHEKKKRRPFAAGNLSLLNGLPLQLVLLSAVVGLVVFLPPLFALTLGVYYLATLAYSTYFKRKLLLDVFVLAGLYTLRVVAGSAVIGVACSPWLLAFSMFLFTSLAFVKRYAELTSSQGRDMMHGSGRGYLLMDRSIIANLGTTSGFLCVVILALYINSPQVEPLYKTPIVLWLLCPLLMYWISRVWVFAAREKMDMDPVVFALKDRISYGVGLCAAAVILVASCQWPPAD